MNNFNLLPVSILLPLLYLAGCREENMTDAPDGDCTSSLIRDGSARGECTETLNIIAQFI